MEEKRYVWGFFTKGDGIEFMYLYGVYETEDAAYEDFERIGFRESVWIDKIELSKEISSFE